MKNSIFKTASIIVLILAIFSACSKDDEPTPIKRVIGLFFTDWSNKTVNKIDLVNTPNSVTGLYDNADGILGPTGLTLTEDGYLLVCDMTGNRILRMHKSGASAVDIVYDNTDGVSSPTAIAVNPGTGTIYWCNSGTDQIMKGKADGSVDPATMFGGAIVLQNAFGLAIDLIHDKIYFSDFALGIKQGNLNGSGTPIVLYNNANYAGLLAPSNIFIIPEKNRIYWTDEASNDIVVAALEGNSAPQVLFNFADDGVNRPDGIFVDERAGKIYWSETSTNVIARGNLDGSGGREILVDNVESYSLVPEIE